MACTAAGSRRDKITATAPGCRGKNDLGLVGPRAGPDPGDSSETWQLATVGETGAASVARVRFECAGLGVRI